MIDYYHIMWKNAQCIKGYWILVEHHGVIQQERLVVMDELLDTNIRNNQAKMDEKAFVYWNLSKGSWILAFTHDKLLKRLLLDHVTNTQSR